MLVGALLLVVHGHYISKSTPLPASLSQKKDAKFVSTRRDRSGRDREILQPSVG